MLTRLAWHWWSHYNGQTRFESFIIIDSFEKGFGAGSASGVLLSAQQQPQRIFQAGMLSASPFRSLEDILSSILEHPRVVNGKSMTTEQGFAARVESNYDLAKTRAKEGQTAEFSLCKAKIADSDMNRVM